MEQGGAGKGKRNENAYEEVFQGKSKIIVKKLSISFVLYFRLLIFVAERPRKSKQIV